MKYRGFAIEVYVVAGGLRATVPDWKWCSSGAFTCVADAQQAAREAIDVMCADEVAAFEEYDSEQVAPMWQPPFSEN